MTRVGVALLLLAGAAGLQAQQTRGALVVTSTNAASNEVLVYDTAGILRQTIATGGQGGVSSNAGGIAVRQDGLAVVNFGSGSVSLFNRTGDQLALTQTIWTTSAPVSVAFGGDHLYVLGTTTVESHAIDGNTVSPAPDGVTGLLRADGSAAQVGVAGAQLVITEKSNTAEVVDLRAGAVAGSAVAVPLPAGSDTPFGLVTRGENAYVTIAHSDEVSLVKGGDIVGITATGTVGGGGQHSPCWLALSGPFLFSSNSPSRTLSRFVATGTQIILEAPVAAQTVGLPTDVTAVGQRLAVLDSDRNSARLTQFAIGDDGTLTWAVVNGVPVTANGVGIVR